MKNLTSILALLTMIFVGLACSGDDTKKANEVVAEANKFVTAANESVVKASAKYIEYERKASSIKNDADLTQTRELGKELFPLYDSMKENFQKAGEKFDEASKLKINEKHKEYLETKAKEMKQRSDYSAELRKIPQALIDSSNEKEYKQSFADLSGKINKMTAEAKETADKADKIQKDNPGVIEQAK